MAYFEGRVVAITGAGAGIGRELALQLNRSGAHVALSDLSESQLQATTELCALGGGDVYTSVVDVANRAAVLAYSADVASRFGRVDVLINNAGILFAGDVLDTTFEDYERVIEVDFWGVVNGTKAFLPHVMRSDRGRIVNISSALGLVAAPSYSAYSAAKFAVRGFTESLRQEMDLGGHPVKVICIHPGGIRTTIARTARHAAGVDRAELADSFERRIARTDPATAARTILRGVQRGSARVVIGADAKTVDVIARTLGARYLSILPALSRLGL